MARVIAWSPSRSPAARGPEDESDSRRAGLGRVPRCRRRGSRSREPMIVVAAKPALSLGTHPDAAVDCARPVVGGAARASRASLMRRSRSRRRECFCSKACLWVHSTQVRARIPPSDRCRDRSGVSLRLACESEGVVSRQRARESGPGHRPGLGERVQLSAGLASSSVDGMGCAAGRSLPAMKLAFALMAAINGSTGSWVTLSHGL